jgi:ankyrin repeat protein
MAKLLRAVESCDLRRVRKLLAEGANPNAASPSTHDEYRPLSLAVMVAEQQGAVEILRELLASGRVDVNARGPQGATALYLACQNGRLDIARLLLERPDVAIEAAVTSGTSPL